MKLLPTFAVAILASAFASCPTVNGGDEWTVAVPETSGQNPSTVEIESVVAYVPESKSAPIVMGENVPDRAGLESLLAAVRENGGVTASPPPATVPQGLPLRLSTENIPGLTSGDYDVNSLAIEMVATVSGPGSANVRWKLGQTGSGRATLSTESTVPMDVFVPVGGLICNSDGDAPSLELVVFTRISSPSAPGAK